MQILLYSSQSSPRVEYIVSTLFNAIGLTVFEITSEVAVFSAFGGPKINYSQKQINDSELWLKPAPLLFEQGIKPQNIGCSEWNNLKIFYQTEGFIPFDIFAASFYLITRYEEYLPHQLDEYGRYAHKNSLAYKEDFLHLPLINLWMNELKDCLLSKFEGLLFKQRTFEFIPTYDIDMAWNYKGKGIVRNVGGAIKSILKGDVASVIERVAVLLGKKKDPFDIYKWLDELHDRHDLHPYYFFLLAAKSKQYDKNVSPSHKQFQKLLKEHSLKRNISIHPSWQSGDNPSLLTLELKNLRQVTGNEIKNSRQHYIRMKLPETYRKLINNGIKRDFSMGYGSINGFRASYCLPYHWYDIERDEQTDLLIHPFCYMEVNSYYEQRFTLHQATEELYYYYRVTKQVEGVLITIWHNHTLGNKKEFAGWKEMYEQFCRNLD